MKERGPDYRPMGPSFCDEKKRDLRTCFLEEKEEGLAKPCRPARSGLYSGKEEWAADLCHPTMDGFLR